MPEMIIRQARISDMDELVVLLKDLFSIEDDFTFSESIQRRGLRMMIRDQRNGCVIVAEKNQKVIGMCSAQLLVSTAEGGRAALVEDMVVPRPFRREGIGKKILLSIEKWASEQNAKRLQLLADQNNIPALRFYEKMDWTTTKLICLRKK